MSAADLMRLLRSTETDVGTLTRNLAQVPDELQDLDFDASEVMAGIERLIGPDCDGDEEECEDLDATDEENIGGMTAQTITAPPPGELEAFIRRRREWET